MTLARMLLHCLTGAAKPAAAAQPGSLHLQPTALRVPQTVRSLLCRCYGRPEAVTDELVESLVAPARQPGSAQASLLGRLGRLGWGCLHVSLA